LVIANVALYDIQISNLYITNAVSIDDEIHRNLAIDAIEINKADNTIPTSKSVYPRTFIDIYGADTFNWESDRSRVSQSSELSLLE
jgi:hypothetical protein